MPSLSFQERRSLSARSPYNSLASLSQLARRARELQAEVRVLPEERVVAVANLAEDVVEAVAVLDVADVLPEE